MAATDRARSGSVARSQAHLLTVNEATGRSPVRVAQVSAPRRAVNASAAWAARVSFQSMALRSGAPAASSATSPCC